MAPTSLTLRPLRWPDDQRSLLALDTSFTTDRVYHLRGSDRSLTLEEVQLESPIRKVYPFAEELDTLAGKDWMQVAVQGEEVVGVVAMRLETWNRRAVIEHLYVSPFHRRQGVGGALVEAVVLEARRRGARCVWVETQTINFAAIRFYEQRDFVWSGFDRSHYDPTRILPGEVALFFARMLGSECLSELPDGAKQTARPSL